MKCGRHPQVTVEVPHQGLWAPLLRTKAAQPEMAGPRAGKGRDFIDLRILTLSVFWQSDYYADFTPGRKGRGLLGTQQQSLCRGFSQHQEPSADSQRSPECGAHSGLLCMFGILFSSYHTEVMGRGLPGAVSTGFDGGHGSGLSQAYSHLQWVWQCQSAVVSDP